MSMPLIKQTIKKYLFIIFSEKYTNESNKSFVERYVAKHPLLKPEMIVVNDQLHGFKKMSKKVATLEEFPIYLELEGVLGEDELCMIDSLDLYCESEVHLQDRLVDVIYFAKLFGQFVTLERSIDVTRPLEETLVVTSKIQEILLHMFYENIDSTSFEEKEQAEMYIEVQQFNALLSLHLRFFIEFIKVLHDLLIKNRQLKNVKKDVETFFKREGL